MTESQTQSPLVTTPVDALFRSLLDSAPDPMVITDASGRIALVNQETERAFGYSRAELLGAPVELLLPLRFREHHERHRRQYQATPRSRPMGVGMELMALRKDGSEFPVEVSLSPFASGEGLLVTSIIRDVSERRRATDSLRDSEEQFRTAFENSPLAMSLTGLDGRLLRINRAFVSLLGYSELDLDGLTSQSIAHPDDLAAEVAGQQDLLEGTSTSFQMEKRYYHKRGHTVWTQVSVSLVRGALGEPLRFIRQIQDVTLRRGIEAERDRLLEGERQKSDQLATIIREAHHRIKNNLQAITDLLSLELGRADVGEGGAALRQSIERIQAIAVVHDLLSRDAGLEYVDLQQLAVRLVPTVLRANARTAAEVELGMSIAPLSLPSREATSVALILNELVSNAAKHAFSAGRAGMLMVQVTSGSGAHRLVVRDNGPGLPAGFDLDLHANVGMQVVRTLAQGNLKGKLAFSSDQGLCVEITFPAGPPSDPNPGG